MKKATIAFFIFVFASLGYVAGYKEIKRVVYRKQLLPNMNFGKKVPHEEVTLQKRFVITIPSYRNAHLCEGNLRSVFEQKYDNYRVIYVDDGSPDGTYEKVKQIVTDFNQWHRFTLLKNETNRGAMYNHALMSEYYDNDEIVVMLDGDDRLASDLVLQELNRYYANPKVWVTYGQYITYPEYKVGLCKPMSFYSLKKGVVRDQQWVTSALRTFYGGLFRRINKEDFLYGDVFLPMACDLAYMFPIVEMAREHVYYTQDIGYIYHLNTGINDQTKSRSEQVFFEKFCRERPRYNALKEHPSLPIAKQKVRSTDVFIFAQQKPVELSATLESLVSHRNEIGEVCIFIDSDDDKVASGYERVKKDYPFARYVNENDLKESLSHILTRPGSTHVLLLSEGMIIDEDTKIKECAEDLEKSGMLAFALYLNKDIVPDYQHVIAYPSVKEGLFGVAFSSEDRKLFEKDPSYFANLYRKSDLQKWIKEEPEISSREFLAKWPNHHHDDSALIACRNIKQVAHIYDVTSLGSEFFAKEALDMFIKQEPFVNCLKKTQEQVVAEAF